MSDIYHSLDNKLYNILNTLPFKKAIALMLFELYQIGRKWKNFFIFIKKKKKILQHTCIFNSEFTLFDILLYSDYLYCSNLQPRLLALSIDILRVSVAICSRVLLSTGIMELISIFPQVSEKIYKH